MITPGCVSGVRIRAVTGAYPGHQVDILRDLAADFGTDELKRLTISTGISGFRMAAEGQTATDLACAAAQAILAKEDVAADQVDALVFVTQTPDFLLPASGALLQERLGLGRHVVTFDINSGCAGYVQGLMLAASLIAGGGLRRVLLVTGDTTTRLIGPHDRSLRVLFGDGAGATLLERGAEDDLLAFHMGTDGSGAESLIVRNGMFRNYPSGGHGQLEMDGVAVMNFAIKAVPSSITNAVAARGWQMDDVRHFVLHQANRIIVDVIRRRLRVSADRCPAVMQWSGNTGPASIPLALCSIAEGLEKTVLSGFGVGLMWGSLAVDLSGTHIHPPVTV